MLLPVFYCRPCLIQLTNQLRMADRIRSGISVGMKLIAQRLKLVPIMASLGSCRSELNVGVLTNVQDLAGIHHNHMIRISLHLFSHGRNFNIPLLLRD